MSYFREPCKESIKTLKLSKSQVSLTPRSGKQNSVGCHESHRPCSAVHCHRTSSESPPKYARPKSAECMILNQSHSKSLQWALSPSGSLSGDSSLRVSQFTDSSSKLLQNLLGDPSSKESILDNESSCAPSSCRRSIGHDLEAINVERDFNSILSMCDNTKLPEEVQVNSNNSVNKEGLHLKSLSEVPEVAGEKTVRFSNWHQLDSCPENKMNCQKICAYYDYKKKYHTCLKKDFEPIFQESVQWKEASDKTEVFEEESQVADSKVRDRNEIKMFYSVGDGETLKSTGEKCYTPRANFAIESDNKKLKKAADDVNDILKSPSFKTELQVENMYAENNFCKKLPTTQSFTNMETDKIEKPNLLEKDLKHDCPHQKVDLTDSTYEEIVHLLHTLDEEDSESLNMENKEEEATGDIQLKDSSLEKVDYLNAVSSYLEEVEIEDDEFTTNYDPKENWSSKSIISPRLDELLNKNSVELAHEVFSLKIQIEDQKKGIKLLRDTLAEMKEAKKSEELEHQEALHKATSEAEVLVKRHQKFIKQLLNEKKNLNETVSKLVEDLKSGEERYKKNLKAIEEKHSIEIKRAKEAQAVADKIKREKWMENKTKKIKEMTVKGLEPELSRMAARQQEEMTELRNLHKAELEAVELRAARRNAELMDELRAELTKEKERAIAKETSTLRSALEKEFEEEKNKLQQYCQNLKERIRKLEERLSNQELEFQQRLIDYKQEEERNKQKIVRNFQENLEEVRRQHLVELRNLKESEEADRQILLSNCRKEEAAKFLEREAELHQQYKKERDKEIEMVIEALEKESAQIQLELNTANESRLKRLKDKLEAEIKELEVSEDSLKVKLSEAKSKLSEKDDFITKLNAEIRQLQTEITFFKKSCEEMSLEKAKLKEIIRGEFENQISGLIKEKENLEKEISILKELHTKELAKKDQQNLQVKYEMQKELTRVYSRIKTAVSKKEKIIESLREENAAVNQKCRQLEFLLDQQRKNLLLQ